MERPVNASALLGPKHEAREKGGRAGKEDRRAD